MRLLHYDSLDLEVVWAPHVLLDVLLVFYRRGLTVVAFKLTLVHLQEDLQRRINVLELFSLCGQFLSSPLKMLISVVEACGACKQAKEAGAQEAIYIDHNGMVKEGAATNVWIVDHDGNLVTRPAEHGILRGNTRTTLMDVAAKLGVTIVERFFSVEEMMAAREVFITAATSICFPVVSIDGETIANGHPGSMSQKIREAFFDVAEKTVI